MRVRSCCATKYHHCSATYRTVQARRVGSYYAAAAAIYGRSLLTVLRTYRLPLNPPTPQRSTDRSLVSKTPLITHFLDVGQSENLGPSMRTVS